MKIYGLLSAVAVAGAINAVADDNISRQFDAKGVKIIEAATSSCDVTYNGGNGESISLKITDYSAKECSITFNADKKKFWIKQKPEFRERCKAHITINGPSAVEMDVKTGSGDVAVSNTSEDAEIRSGSGNIQLINHGAPKGKTTTKLHSGSGSIKASGLAGTLKLSSGSGDVSVTSFDGDMELRTASGNISVDKVTGNALAATASGDITGDISASELELTSISGRIRASALTAPLKAETASGNIALKWKDLPKTGKMKIKSVSGNIALSIPSSAHFAFDARSVSGKITSEFTSTPETSRLSLSISSVSGDIAINKS